MKVPSACLAFALAVGCTRLPPDPPADDLAGYRGRLTPGPALRLSVEGAVGEHPAEVWLDLASPLTTVTTGCYQTPPSSAGVVRSPTPEGPMRELPEVQLRRARLGMLRLGPRSAGLVKDERCVVSLGSDVLLPYAVQFDPVRREVALTPSLPREAYSTLMASPDAQKSGDEYHLLELTKDPVADWPLLAVRLRQGQAQLTGPFVLSTREANSVASVGALQAARFQAGLELDDSIALPDSPAKRGPPGFAAFQLDELELSPGFGLKSALVWSDARWTNHGVLGAVGANVWGRFWATFDLQAGVMVLRRPRVLAAGSRQQCMAGAPALLSEEGCFALHSWQEGGGLSAVGTVWRDLPEGGRLYLEPVGADGAALRGECRFGISFSPTDRGASSSHRLPWAGLMKSLPACADTLRKARSVRLALFEEGESAECPGQCIFATQLTTARTSCECAPHLGGASEDERRFLEMYRRLLEKHKAPRSPRPEPPPEKEPE